MANSKSSKKRIRVAERRREENKPLRTEARTFVKKAEVAIAIARRGAYVGFDRVTLAIVPDSDGKAEKWLKLNADLAVKWPNITRKGAAPPDADAWKDVPGKFEKFFSPEPGKGE